MSGDRTGTLRVELGDGPFRVDYEHLLETTLRRGGVDPEAALRGATLRGTYREETLVVARQIWLERMRREHNSAAVFSALLPQLMAAEASIDVKAAALKMAIEELRHARLAGGVVELLGGEAALEADLETPAMALHEKCTPLERALRNVIFVGCINETIGVAMLTEERELVDEPAIEAVLTLLIADEVGHSRLGWLYLAEVWPRLDDEARARTSAYLPYAFGYLEQELMKPMARLRFSDAARDELSALGISSPRDMRELFYQVIETAVLPPLDACGLAASEGWRDRREI